MSGISSLGGSYAASAPSITSGASPAMSPNQKMGNLFDQIDSSGTGSITQNQLQQALTTQNPPAAFKALGADAIFSQLDFTGTGSVSKQGFISGMANVRDQIRSGANSAGSPAQTIKDAGQTLDSLTNGAGSGSTFSVIV